MTKPAGRHGVIMTFQAYSSSRAHGRGLQPRSAQLGREAPGEAVEAGPCAAHAPRAAQLGRDGPGQPVTGQRPAVETRRAEGPPVISRA